MYEKKNLVVFRSEMAMTGIRMNIITILTTWTLKIESIPFDFFDSETFKSQVSFSKSFF